MGNFSIIDWRALFFDGPGTRLAATACVLAVLAASGSASAQRREQSGKEVVDKACAACHAKGASSAPRIGDEKAWSKRASQGLTALTENALRGIRSMPAHGGDKALSDLDIERAIIYMVNQSGGRWVEPMGGATPAVIRGGERIVQTQCSKCHQDGANGAPKIGDRAKWVPRLSKGLDNLVKSAINGHGPMPARGGVADLSDVEIRSAIVYMFNYGINPAPIASRQSAAPDPYHKLIADTDIYLGIRPVEAIPAAQRQGKVPSGQGYYHVNISLFDAKTKSAVTDAKVTLRVADPISGETKALEMISANNTISFGSYFRMLGNNAYTITAQIQRPGASGTTEAKFEYKPR
ncbi:MAG: c-type cytochrome [Burkholderiales bacterium]